ncbi:hypothetical protein MKX03_003686 [Papaver bracteatum]|nr:hypothetical protein MKX03_003686 [Papaver bracteatum]
MNWRSERIWIELITGSRKTSNFCWACILLLGSLGFLLVGTSSYLGRNLISLFPSQEILFFPQGIVMSFYGIAGLFISSYLWCTISWNVGSGYDRFDRKEGIVCIFRWGFPGINRRIFLRFLMRDVQSIRIEIKEGLFPRRVLYMEIRGQGAIPLTRTDENLTPREIEQKAAELAYFLKHSLPSHILHLFSFLPWWVSISFNKNLESWVTNWWNTRQPEMFLNYIKEKNLLEKFIELEELFFLDEIIKEYPETHIQKLRIEIHKETIQLVKMHNEGHIHSILHFSTNIICFAILSGYSILGNEELLVLNSWVKEFLYNLSDTIKAFSILLLTDLCIGFHSPHGWELMIGSISKDFGFDHNDQIISGLVSTFPVILDTLLKYWIFRYLNRVSPSLVVIYHSMND